MEEAEIEAPTFKYLTGSLPNAVHCVIKEIQNHMMDEMRDRRRPKVLPNMPKDFLCSQVIGDTIKEKMMEIAGEDLPEKDEKQKLDFYQIFIPFPVYPCEINIIDDSQTFNWSRNVVSFCQISVNNPEFVAIKIEGNLAKVKNYSTGQRELTFFPISSDKEEREKLPSQPLKKFLKSSSVVEQPAGQHLISSDKMTISWLRSRLHKALNAYRDEDKQVEVIATIKQKTDGPLFLRLHVEELSYLDQVTEYDVLFAICPALRIARCHLAVPVVDKLNDVSFKNKDIYKHFLWEIVMTCHNNSYEHVHGTVSVRDLSGQIKAFDAEVEESKEKLEEKTTDENTLHKLKSSEKVCDMTPSQYQQCEMCGNPASRILLEYYYQHGYIPADEMKEAYSFVWEILAFLQGKMEEDQKANDPKILEFVESGSVPEKLKVVQPDEFDVMIRIDLPRSTGGYTFVVDDTFPTGFAICQVKRSKSFSRALKRCFRKSDEFGHCLAPEQLAFGWLYGKLERAINDYKNREEVKRKANLKLRRSGPALLLEITPVPQPGVSRLPRVISVDLVLALKLSKDDSRYAVAKRAKEEQFYKMVAKKLKPGDESDPSRVQVQDENVNHSSEDDLPNVDVQNESAVDDTNELARQNLKYLWRISYSAQEKQYLEYVREIQQKENVDGCQEICLMVLKTICTREILKRKESVISHKLSSYILKTALFHVLAKSDLIQDWKMDCLADRYVDVLDELSNWRELPHFFFNNASYLTKVFPEESWCNSREQTSSKNLLSELHATLKIQLFDRFSQIASSFKNFNNAVEKKCESMEESLPSNHALVLSEALEKRNLEEVIHPPFRKFKTKGESRRLLVEDEAEDIRIGKAAKTERKSGSRSDASRNLQRSHAAKKVNTWYDELEGSEFMNILWQLRMYRNFDYP